MISNFKENFFSYLGIAFEKLPVIVTLKEGEQLLGVHSLGSGTGAAIGKAIVKCLTSWNGKNQVIAMVFDTTASNTGQKNGACALVERYLDKDLLNLA